MKIMKNELSPVGVNNKIVYNFHDAHADFISTLLLWRIKIF